MGEKNILELFYDWCDEQVEKTICYIGQETIRLKSQVLNETDYEKIPPLVDRINKLNSLKADLVQVNCGVHEDARNIRPLLAIINEVWN